MGNKLVTSVAVFITVLLGNGANAQPKDTVEYIKISKGTITLKKANSNEAKFEYQGKSLSKLLFETDFFYTTEHPLTTRSGFLLGWYFKLSERWKINVYFDKGPLKESDNVYLNNIGLDSVRNEKIKRIEIVKQRM